MHRWCNPLGFTLKKYTRAIEITIKRKAAVVTLNT